MTESKEPDRRKKPLRLARPGKLELKKTVETGQVRQSFSHGRSKMVTVEVRKKRTFAADDRGHMHEVKHDGRTLAEAELELTSTEVDTTRLQAGLATLTTEEKAARARALEDFRKGGEPMPSLPASWTDSEEAPEDTVEGPSEEEPEGEAVMPTEPPAETPSEEGLVAEPAAEEPITAPSSETPSTEAAPAAAEGPAVAGAPEPVSAPSLGPVPAPTPPAVAPAGPDAAAGAPPVKPAEGPVHRKHGEKPKGPAVKGKIATAEEESDEVARAKGKRTPRAPAGVVAKPPVPSTKRAEPRRRTGKLTISAALDDGDERTRSLAAVRRARQKEKQKQQRLMMLQDTQKVVRDVIIPETITVQELANRMAERGTDVIKSLMRMGVMVTINQTIDADTAELVAREFGHNVKRVSDADVEIGLRGAEDTEENLEARAPVVTVMGHVDHGKTSLLDALRSTDVASGEAGGITQHIGAYEVRMSHGAKITFIDTPGHEAFTAMRARGAEVTDIVVLVVAADDGIMPQTVEAIHHARAASVPLVVAINKMDKPDADAERVRTELLQHGVVVESMSGDVLCVEVSAKARLNLDKLEEAILLQAELLDLRANPERPAGGVVIEARMERGRGTVATLLVQRGTLRTGDILVAGAEWGRVRALIESHGRSVESAGPAEPVEVLGLNSTPLAGDDFVVVDSESRAREVSEFRKRKERESKVAATARGTLEQMFSRIREGEAKELPVVIKGDVQGSVEAIVGALEKLSTEEVKARILHSAVGGINESDVTLARASQAIIIGFNVRANPQARDMARRDDVEIRYYSIIYDVIDDLKKVLSGMMAPTLREHQIGYAQIREVFNITKVGKVAGCMVTEGTVRRGAKVRLLRDHVVVHEGDLSQLKRYKDDVKDVKEGMECGMSFANYHDLQVGDVIECFEIEEVARQL